MITRCTSMGSQLIKLLMCMAGYAADGKQYSLLEYLLWETEQMHGRIRRYTSPDEHAFFSRDLPPLVLPPIQYPEVKFKFLPHPPEIVVLQEVKHARDQPALTWDTGRKIFLRSCPGACCKAEASHCSQMKR